MSFYLSLSDKPNLPLQSEQAIPKHSNCEDKNSSDSKIEKLSFQDMVGRAEKMNASYENYDSLTLKNMVQVLDQWTIQKEKKHFFLRLNRILKTHFNFSFSTTTEKVRVLSQALSLKQAKLSKRELKSIEVTRHPTGQEIDKIQSLAFKLTESGKTVCLGKGKGAQGVYDAESNQAIKVERSAVAYTKRFIQEYRIGAKLDHPNLAKSKSLHLIPSESNSSSEFTFANMYLVMEKIEGTTISSSMKEAEKHSEQIILNALDAAKNCCLYLFDENIAWKDVNDQNIFITNDNQLKICDYGAWSLEPDSKKRALKLLLGSMEATSWLLRTSAIGTAEYNNKSSELKYPKEFFQQDIGLKNIYTALLNFDSNNPNTPYRVVEEHPWVIPLQKKLEHMNDQEIKDFLADYFDQVKAKLREKIESTRST